MFSVEHCCGRRPGDTRRFTTLEEAQTYLQQIQPDGIGWMAIYDSDGRRVHS